MTLTEQIKPFVADIIRDANKGNRKARQVIDLHRLHVSCPADQGAIGLCQAAFDEWKMARDQGDGG